MIDIVEVVLAIMAIFSAVFVGVTEGFKLTLGFASSEETRNRKARIDASLQKELDDEITDFLTSDSIKDGSPDRINGFQELGYKCLVTYGVSDDIIEKSNSIVKFGIRSLFYGIGFLFLSVALGLYVDLSNTVLLIAVLISIAATIYYFWQCFQGFNGGLGLREQFVKLDNDSTLENAMNINEKNL
jgi:hypothetical protein